MPSAAHTKENPTSDHERGNAFDLTHDPESGPDCFNESLQVIRDHRVTYVIFNGQIYKARTGKWEPYRGPNPHKKHMHVSIKAESRDDLSPWPWSPKTVEGRTLKRGDKGADVALIQRKLGVNADGIFGLATEQAVKDFQARSGLSADGIVGPRTWAALNK